MYQPSSDHSGTVQDCSLPQAKLDCSTSQHSTPASDTGDLLSSADQGYLACIKKHSKPADGGKLYMSRDSCGSRAIPNSQPKWTTDDICQVRIHDPDDQNGSQHSHELRSKDCSVLPTEGQESHRESPPRTSSWSTISSEGDHQGKSIHPIQSIKLTYGQQSVNLIDPNTSPSLWARRSVLPARAAPFVVG